MPENMIESDEQLSFTQDLAIYENQEPALINHDASFVELNSTLFANVREWVHKRKMAIAVGATVLSMSAGAVLNPIGKTWHKIENHAEYVVPAGVGMDLSIGVGFAMMAASAGSITKNPFKARKHFNEIAQNANDSRLFKSGYWLSTAAAVGFFGVASGAAIETLPPESWAAPLIFTTSDLALTIGSRRLLWKSIQGSVQEPSE